MFKNDPESGSSYAGISQRGHRMLRVMESVRSSDGDERAFDWYWESGSRIHQLGDPEFDFGDALEQLGLDRSHSAAAADTAWDTEIRSRMDAGLELVGDDVGTPIIAFLCDDGVKRGIFGPVISRMPTGDQALALWDAMETVATMDGFWELKRTRTERPSFPPIS
jgi:hypothetical protein